MARDSTVTQVLDGQETKSIEEPDKVALDQHIGLEEIVRVITYLKPGEGPEQGALEDVFSQSDPAFIRSV